VPWFFRIIDLKNTCYLKKESLNLLIVAIASFKVRTRVVRAFFNLSVKYAMSIKNFNRLLKYPDAL
jgi:hypothetical protein